MDIKDILTILQTFTTFGTLCMMLYALRLFLKKPQDSLIQRVTELEVKVKDMENSLHMGNDNFKEIKKFCKLIVTSIVALIEFENDYCTHHGDEKISPKLEKSKNDLLDFLAEK